MTGLFKITNLAPTNSGFTMVVAINPSHSVFAGHFPGQPVVPGVVLLEIASASVSLATGKPLIMKEAAVVKFLRMVDPRVNPVLLIDCSIVEETEDGIKANLRFYFEDADFAKLKGISFTQSNTEFTPRSTE